MRFDRELLVISTLATLALAACGGSITSTTRPDASPSPDATTPDATTTIPCAAMGACECLAASDRCTARTEDCWCPTECHPEIACICGGGRFLACQNRTMPTTACADQVARVQALCAGKPFVQYLANVCNGGPVCVAECLAQLQDTTACDQIDCGFCPTCDCAPPAQQSALAACLAGCVPLP